MSLDPNRPLRLGLLYSQTGPTAFVERSQLNATLLAIEEVNAAGGIGGREIVAVTADAQSNPARFARIAEQMLDDDKAAMLIGCYMSSTRQAVLPIVERRGVLLGYAAPYEGFEYSANVLYGGAVPNQHILLLARYLMRERGKRFYFVGTRYTFPIESNRVMMTLVAEQKGRVLAERYIELDATHKQIAAVVQDIRNKQPDVIFCTVVGETAAVFYELCREAQILDFALITSLTITEAETALMPPGLTEGHLTAATYFRSVETEENKRFLAHYKARFGDDMAVNTMAETAYGLTHATLAAVAACESVEPETVRAQLAPMRFRAPQGEIRLDADNSHFYLWPRIGRANAAGQFEIIDEVLHAVKPDPYLVNHALADWDADGTIPIDVAQG